MTNATRKAISQTCLALILAAFHPQPSTALEQPATTAQPQKDTTDEFDYSFDRLSFEVTKSLGDRPAFVIWLLDESGSVHERRTRVLERLDQIYGSNQRPHSLYSAIAGFGDKTHFLTPDPVSELASLKAAADQLKQDDSGVERVFTAVVDCVERWKDFIKEHKELDVSIVLATDEIGDDPEQLEDAVKECRNHGIRIFCLGNAAPFGQSKGYVRYVYEDGFRSEIPVDQGPETAIADVLNLPIWPPHSPEQFRQISSGFGPWALSRLCNATDGTFFIVEDTGKPTFPRAPWLITHQTMHRWPNNRRQSATVLSGRLWHQSQRKSTHRQTTEVCPHQRFGFALTVRLHSAANSQSARSRWPSTFSGSRMHSVP